MFFSSDSQKIFLALLSIRVLDIFPALPPVAAPGMFPAVEICVLVEIVPLTLRAMLT